MTLSRSTLVTAAMAALVSSCCQPDPTPAPTPVPTTAPSRQLASAKPPSQPSALIPAVPTASAPGLTDECKEPALIVDVQTQDAFEQQEVKWRWTRQLMLAHPQFHAVSKEPQTQGEVRFFNAVDEATKTVRLVARCGDPATCNFLAAAHRRLAPSRSPQAICGKASLSAYKLKEAEVLHPQGPEQSLPAPTDFSSQCIRIAACKHAAIPDLKEDVALGCLTNPSSVNIECGLRKQCDEVVACLDQRDQ